VSDAGLSPIALMTRKHQGATYVFAVRLEDSPARGDFEVKGITGKAAVEVLGENRTLESNAGRFSDDFQGLAVHLYKIAETK
jgi:hypothetical protein